MLNARVIPAAAALVPVLLAPGLFLHYDVTPKIFVLLAAAAAVLWKLHTAPRRLAALAALQAISLALSTAASSDPALSLAGTDWRRFGLATQCAVLVLALGAASGGMARFCIRAVAGVGIPIALYGIAQYFGWDPLLPARAYHTGEGPNLIVRPPGTLGYVTYFANFLVFVVFYGVDLCGEETGFWRKAGGAAAALAAVAIVLSGTRGAMLGLAAGAVVLWLWLGRPKLVRPWAMAGIAAVAALFVLSPAGTLLRNRARWAVEDARGGARLWLWRDSLRLAARHPVLGTGVETFPREFPAVESRELARAYPDFHHESPHHFVLDALTAQGAIGAAILIGWLWMAAAGAWRLRKKKPRRAGALAAALAGAVAAHWFAVWIAPTALCFYLTVALLCPVEPRLTLPRWRWAGSIALGILAIRIAVGDGLLQRSAAWFSAGRPDLAAKAYHAARGWGAGGDLWYSRHMAGSAEGIPEVVRALPFWHEAISAGVRATQTDEDRANAWYHLASVYARRGDSARAEDALRSAIACSPYWFKPHWTLARLLALSGRRDEARVQAAEARELDAGVHPEVASTTEPLLR